MKFLSHKGTIDPTLILTPTFFETSQSLKAVLPQNTKLMGFSTEKLKNGFFFLL